MHQVRRSMCVNTVCVLRNITIYSRWIVSWVRQTFPHWLTVLETLSEFPAGNKVKNWKWMAISCFNYHFYCFFAFRVFSDSKHNFSGLRTDPTQFCANTLLRIMCPAGMEEKNNRICVEYICKYPRLHISFETDVLEIHFRISHFTCVNWLSSFRTFISMCFITCTSLFEFKKKINKNYISVYFHMFNK